MTSTDFKEQCAIIKYCVNLGKTPTQTRTLMQQANMSTSVSRSLVFKWHDRYRQGRETLEDDGGRGRKQVVDVTLVERVKDFVLADRRVTMNDICHETGLSYGTASRILTNELNMQRESILRKVKRTIMTLQLNSLNDVMTQYSRRQRWCGPH